MVGLMVHRLSPRMCFLVVAALPLLIALSSFVMREKRSPCCGGRRGERLRIPVSTFATSHSVWQERQIVKSSLVPPITLMPCALSEGSCSEL